MILSQIYLNEYNSILFLSQQKEKPFRTITEVIKAFKASLLNVVPNQKTSELSYRVEGSECEYFIQIHITIQLLIISCNFCKCLMQWCACVLGICCLVCLKFSIWPRSKKLQPKTIKQTGMAQAQWIKSNWRVLGPIGKSLKYQLKAIQKTCLL